MLCPEIFLINLDGRTDKVLLLLEEDNIFQSAFKIIVECTEKTRNKLFKTRGIESLKFKGFDRIITLYNIIEIQENGPNQAVISSTGFRKYNKNKGKLIKLIWQKF